MGRFLTRIMPVLWLLTLVTLSLPARANDFAANHDEVVSASDINQTNRRLDCPDEYQIHVTFPTGSGWQLCWDSRLRENIVLSDIHYQPSANATPISVLESIRLSQLNVAYDDSAVTYSDVTQYGLGQRNISQLNPSDCPSGEVLEINGIPGLCKRVTVSGDSTNANAGPTPTADSLILYSTSQVGSYAYLVTWQFFADGSIRPSVGAAGALQRSSDEPSTAHGRKLGSDNDKVWLSHTHNYYWRLDFDLGERSDDDRVFEWLLQPESTGTQSNQYRQLTTESALKVSPDSQLSWFIADTDTDAAHARGYLLEPVHTGHRYVRESVEPYSAYDFFVTQQKDCERFATDNGQYYPDCTDTVLDFANNETLIDQDIVVWHRVSFHHVPRNEDLESMHAHWDGFHLSARNLGFNDTQVSAYTAAFSDHDHGATEHTLVTTAPALLMENRQSSVGETVAIDITSATTTAETHTYTATGLPAGLSLSEGGVLTGTPSNPGLYSVAVRVASTGQLTTTYTFDWEITESADQPLGCSVIGTTPHNSLEWWLLLFALYTSTAMRKFGRSQQCH